MEEFLWRTRFEGYQSVPLPFGLRVPGTDRSGTADSILGDRVRGKSVLDVGTFYGFYPLEASRRGAARSVGLEPNPERYKIAQEIARLNGDRYEIVQGSAEEVPLDWSFDVVLLLKVIHHMADPVAAVRRLAAICREVMVIQFRLPSHGPNVLRDVAKRTGEAASLSAKVRARMITALMRWLQRQIPVATIGSTTGFHFSPEAFRNLFVVQNRLFSEIEFTFSPPTSITAVCRLP
ncbi:MAG: class I SAM-dependent methyltransferase [Actinomycetota bacterium]